MTVRLSTSLDEQDWMKLRRLAEVRRMQTSGRPSVGVLIAELVKEGLQRVQAQEAEREK